MKNYPIFLLLFLVALTGCATPRRVVTPVSPAVIGAPTYHVVEKGQTLYRIAKTYNVSVDELMSTNGIVNSRNLEIGQRLSIPRAGLTGPTAAFTPGAEQIRRLVAVRNRGKWRTITVHHSGTVQGSAKAFNKDHLRRGMGGLFYHFVIGNGTKTQDGLIEVGFRWRKQVNANRPEDIQICLVGDFNRQKLTDRQMTSLVNLIRVLSQEYHIPVHNIRKHEDIKGKHTACPGKYFPFGQLISEVSS